ncbi:MAG: HAD family hydrolase [Cyanobium sp. CACIAM 14]|nr:MAG: HAD family hydrolase [Cyanobium sp. CACIAM 14]
MGFRCRTVLLTASQPIWSLPLERVYPALQTSPEGLATEEAQRRLDRYGPNRLPPQKRRPLALRFVDQMVHFMALLLWVAGGLAFAARTPQLGWAIWAVVLINGLFSFWQEFHAERTLAALTRSLPRQVQVWRDRELGFLPVEELVAGDRLLIEEGDKVPADARLTRAIGLYVDLSVLTGESLPVARDSAPVPQDGSSAPVATSERSNLLLAGTTVTSGRGEAIVYATGPETEFGQVARLAAATQRSASTLEVQVGRIVRTITTIALATGAVVFGLDLLFVGMPPLESLVFAVGIIVAFVPEGLLPQVTLTLALNVKRMAKRQALVRRLSAVETLGSVSVICSDKTGTLTGNRMAVEATWLVEPSEPLRRLLLRGAALCSNARLEHAAPGAGATSEPWRAVGDPTETALLLAAVDADLSPEEQQGRHPRRREIPFDSHRRRMTVVVDWVPGADDLPGHLALQAASAPPALVITKGAPLEVLEHCSGWITPAGREALDAERRRRVVAANDALAARGFRVLALALRTGDAGLDGMPGEELEADQLFLGLIGLYDPPRPEVPDAVRRCLEAGIRVTMVTGDYGLTAQAIAQQIGLLDPPALGPGNAGNHRSGADPVRVIEGAGLSHVSDVQLRQLIKYRRRLVFARMAPEQKLRLVQAYRALGDVVAVTGDGVNDAPALRAADVGVAMGCSGTDVAREAADVVLLDDNFATIVEAVRYGRSVVSNIRKFITYILVANVSEAVPFLAMVVLRIPAALTVLQILAVDLGTDILPALGLGAELPEAGLMRVPPRPRDRPLLDRAVMVRGYLVLGLAESLTALAGYLLVWRHEGIPWSTLRSLAPQLLHGTAPAAVEAIQRQAGTMAFCLIVAGQMGALLACRSDSRPAWETLWLPNRLLALGLLSEPVAAGCLVLLPPLAAVFGMVPFPPGWLGLMALAPLLVIGADTLHKGARRRWA